MPLPKKTYMDYLFKELGNLGLFDPEGSDYDYATARDAGFSPDKTGHWPSRDPRSGLILKGRGHKTWDLTAAEEEKIGYSIFKLFNRYYSFPTDEVED